MGTIEDARRDKIRVFLLDDHELVRDGIRAVIDMTDDLAVVGEASTCAEALARIPATRPDVAVLDACLPDGNGIDVCRLVRSRVGGVRCMILSAYADRSLLAQAEVTGVAGYMLKHVRARDLPEQIRRVASGATVIDPELHNLAVADAETSAHGAPELAALTDLETKVLRLIAEGCTNRQIATHLTLAEKTIKNYVSSILRKLNLSHRTEAAVLYLRAHGTTSGSDGHDPQNERTQKPTIP